MALTTNEQILDRYIRHQTYILRYAGGLRNEVLPTLASTEKKVRDLVLAYVSRAPGRVIAGKEGRQWQAEFEAALTELRSPSWEKMTTEVDKQLKELAIAEAAAGATVIESAVPVVLNLTLPPAAQLISVVNSQPFEGRTLKQWMARSQQADVQRMLTIAKIGVTQGLTPTQITQSVVGTKGGNYRDGAMRKAFRDVESVLLTLTNGIQQEAKQALYAANADIIEEELYVATLDIRTTLECASNDGKKFLRGTGPIPPLHFRCRSLRIPYLNPEALGDRPFNANTEKQLLSEFEKETGVKAKSRSALPRGYKSSFDAFARKRKRDLIGQVPAQMSFNDWLKAQSKDFQDQYLGKTKAEMFRNGDLHLDKFVARDGDTLTLNQLKRKGLEVPDKPITRKSASFLDSSSPVSNVPPKPKSKGFVDLPDSPAPPKATLDAPKPLRLSSEELGRVEYYKGDGFYDMNKRLLNPDTTSASQYQVALVQRDALDSIITKSRTSKDHTFYRGLRSKELFTNAETLIGQTLENITPQSTSYDEAIARNYAGLIGEFSAEKNSSVILRIKAKKGSAALNIQELTDINSAEKEILLKGNSTYRVTSVENFGQYKIIEVEYESN